MSLLVAGWILRGKLTELGPPMKVGVRSVLDIGLPLMASGLAIYLLTQADLWIAGMFTPGSDVALYGASVRLGALLYMPLLISNTLLPPFIAEMYSQGKVDKLQHVVRLSSSLSTVFASIILIAFVFFGKAILGMAYGDYYRQAYVLLILIGTGQFINVWSGSGVIVLVNTGHAKSVMSITFTSGLLILSGSLLLVGTFGITGIVVATNIVIAGQALFTLFWVRGKTGLWTHAGFRYIWIALSKVLGYQSGG